MRYLFFVFLSVISLQVSAQNTELGIGQWREHLPFNRANSVSAGNGKIYCGSEAAFIEYDLNSDQITRHSTVSGLSDIGIEVLKFNTYTNSLLVAYKNGNLDIVKGSVVTNIPAVKDANIIGDKGVYNIRFEKELAYLSCGFGIVVVNMSRREVKDTYLIGKNSKPIHVNDVFIANGNNQIIAATESGVIQANLDDNLSDFNSWSL
ncbi:MAG TPA: hypothetical protein DCX54_03985, partial [Flavobacteriales bacterium]|nr:hypothetical protein [Flavobacteriales bacterium]